MILDCDRNACSFFLYERLTASNLRAFCDRSKGPIRRGTLCTCKRNDRRSRTERFAC